MKEFGANVGHTTLNGVTSLLLAAQEGNLDVVLCLAKEFKKNVDEVNIDGTSPFHAAVRNEHPDLVQCLIHVLDANIYHVDRTGTKALEYARNAGYNFIAGIFEGAHAVVDMNVEAPAEIVASTTDVDSLSPLAKRQEEESLIVARREADELCQIWLRSKCDCATRRSLRPTSGRRK